MKNPEVRNRRLGAEQRRKQIIECAYQLISKEGFKTVSVRDVARAAQINEALIYRYFPTKNHLLRAIIMDTIEQRPAESFTPAKTCEEFRESLQRFVDYFLDKNGREGSVVRIILYAAMEDFPLPDAFNLNKEGTFLHWLAQSIEQGKQQWGFNPQAEPVVSISLFMGGLIYFVLQYSVANIFASMDVAQFRNTFVDTFLKSLDWNVPPPTGNI